jgi:hypothetical protein
MRCTQNSVYRELSLPSSDNYCPAISTYSIKIMTKIKNQPKQIARADTIVGAAAIQALVAKPLAIKFNFGDQVCELSGRYLLPFETEILRLLLEEVGSPPLLKAGAVPLPGVAGTPAEIYDWADGGYQRRKTQKERFIRALAIFYAIEDIQKLMVADAKETGENEAEAIKLVAGRYKPESLPRIVDWMQRKFVDEILEAIYTHIFKAPISIAKAVNLTSPGGN